MGINMLWRMILRINIFIFTLSLYQGVSAQAPDSKIYYWYRDSEKIELTLLPNHIVDLSPSETAQQEGKALKPIKAKPLKGGGKLLKLSESDFNEVLSENTDPNLKKINTYRSPLFKDNNGSVKAFAGGVLVKFKMGTPESAIKLLCAQNGLEMKRRYSVEGQEPLWLIGAPAGMASMDIANNLMENHGDLILNSRPNFWQPISTKELKGVPTHRKRKMRR